MLNVVVFLVSLGVRVIRAMCRRRADLVLENVALRQQVTALKKERPRPPLDDTERYCQVGVIVARLVPVSCCASRFRQAHVTSCQAMKARPLSSR